MKKYIITFFILIMLTCNFSFAQSENILVGIDGIAPINKPIPIEINKASHYQEGDEIFLSSSSKTVYIKLENTDKAETYPLYKSIIVDTPSSAIVYKLIRNNQEIESYELPCIFSDEISVGVLQDFGSLNLTDEKMQVYDLNADLIEEKKYLDMLDYLYINNYYVETLNQTVQENILQWIAKGGTLIVQKGDFDDKNFSGFLKDMKDKTSLPYMFGQIVTVENVDGFLNTNRSQQQYPTTDINNYRGTAKELIKRSPSSSLQLFLIAIAITVIALIIIWIPERKPYMSLSLYLALTISFFFIMILMYQQPLTSTIDIDWHKGNAVHTIHYTHSIEDVVLDVEEENHAAILYNNEGNSDEYNNLIYVTTFNDISRVLTENAFSIKDDTFSGKFTWNYDTALKKSFILVNDEVVALGNIEKGQKAAINYKLKTSHEKKKDFQRQIEVVKKANWSMTQALLFNEFQEWFQKTNAFDNQCALLIGFYEENNHMSVYVREFTIERGTFNE